MLLVVDVPAGLPLLLPDLLTFLRVKMAAIRLSIRVDLLIRSCFLILQASSLPCIQLS